MKQFKTFAFLATVCTAMAAHSESVTLVSSADAEIQALNAALNLGAETTVVSGRVGDAPTAGEAIRRVLLRFELTNAIPANATVSSVTITVQVARVPGINAVNSTFGLHRLLQAWAEGQVTWNDRLTSITWATAGATGAADAVATASSTVAISDTNFYQFPSTASLVADVQGWVNNPAGNFGWLLRSADEVSLRTARHFTAKEGGAAAMSLTVEYAVPAPLRITGATAGSGVMAFQFQALAGTAYHVEHRGDVAGGAWNTLTNIPAQASNATIAVQDPLTTSNRFYRVRAL